MNILIVDDSPLIQERLSDVILGVPGVQAVHHAKDADEAYQILAKERFQVVILDIQMPKGNGFGVLERVKKDQPEAVVIMLTNYPYEQYKKRSFDLGADYFFNKPTGVDEAAKVIKEVGAHHKAE
jgi:two-component system response regulator (stage 0 sporulation protein A)